MQTIRPKQRLPPGHIRELYAAKQQHGVNTAYLVTTSKFTKESEKAAQELGIKLIDGDEFAQMQIRARKARKSLRE